jgi:uncharacterized protein (DUF4415 family)
MKSSSSGQSTISPEASEGRFHRSKERSTTIRLDEDLILYFKKKASEKKAGYQTLVNAALREYVHDHPVDY